MWPEVQQVKQGSRHELVLTGAEINERIQNDGLDMNIFHQKSLNLLEISFTSIDTIPNFIGKLDGLTRLCLFNNRLTSIPGTIGQLKKLKFLDVSSNELKELAPEINQLTELQGLSANANQLAQLPTLSNCKNLAKVELSHNKFVEFPKQLCSPSLEKLAELNLCDNQLENLPREIEKLPVIKTLSLTNNNITVVPGELANCSKLKDLLLQNNPVKDNRLKKLLNQNPPKYKQIYDYVKAYCKTGVLTDASNNSGKDGAADLPDTDGASAENLTDNTVTAAAAKPPPPLKDQRQIIVLHAAAMPNPAPVVKQTKEVDTVRPHIVCCVVRRLNLSEKNLKKFFKIQTALHDEICEKRMVATIATHDLSKIKAPIVYDGRLAKKLEIHPLNRKALMNADALIKELKTEADQMRKDLKRNTISGIHKYLGLLGGKKFYPCLVDADGAGKVISFPPITNAEDTKVTSQTTDIFIEVTSDKSQPLAKKVLDTLLCEMVEAGLGEVIPLDAPAANLTITVPAEQHQPKDQNEPPSTATAIVGGGGDAANAVAAAAATPKWFRNVLHVQQVQVFVIGNAKSADDVNESLKVVYPSRVDLQDIPDGIEVVRAQGDAGSS